MMIKRKIITSADVGAHFQRAMRIYEDGVKRRKAAAKHEPAINAVMVKDLTDATLFEMAKETLEQHRVIQAEITRRYNARQTPAKAVCGHGARDKTGLHCDCPTCANYVSF